jgi:hypothetical protein
MVVAGAGRSGEVQFHKMKEKDGGDGCTTLYYIIYYF